MTSSAVCAGPAASLIVGPVVASAALIALPFLFPFASGPSANVWQQVAAWTCAALLLLAQPAALPGRGILGWLTVVGGAILLGRVSGSVLDLDAAAAVAVVVAMAFVGAALARAPVSQAALACGLLAAGLFSAVLGLLQYYGLAAPLVPWTTTLTSAKPMATSASATSSPR